MELGLHFFGNKSELSNRVETGCMQDNDGAASVIRIVAIVMDKCYSFYLAPSRSRLIIAA